jgi:hypothetical protein
VYHNRAQAWLQKAESLPEGRERKACFALAKDYARLAKLLDVQQGPGALPMDIGWK